MANKDVDECPVCLEEYNRLKLLHCGHAFCSRCIEITSLMDDVGDVSVLCPFDQSKTNLPDGKAANLKTKFFTNLACESCYTNKSVNESWWCETCGATTCSDCAMKKHRNHSCKEWNDFGVVKECYGLYKSKTMNDDQNAVIDVRNSIHEFCTSLEEKLLNRVNEQEQSKRAMVEMENAFGTIETVVHPEGYVVEKIEKKLNAISKLLQTVLGVAELPQISNSVRPVPVFQPPPMDQILDLCFKITSTLSVPADQSIEQQSTVSHPADQGCLSADNLRLSTANSITFFRNVSYKLENPANTLCTLADNNVAVFDNRGIHIIDVIADKCARFRTWENWSLTFDYYCQSVFRPMDSCLFLCRGYSKSNSRQQLLPSNGELFQFEIGTLHLLNMILLPNDPMIGLGNKRLLAVSKSGNIFAAASDGSASVIWELQKNVNEWLKIWQGKLEIFWDIQMVGPSLLISGQTKVYSFSINRGQVTTATVCSGCGTLFQMTNNVFLIDVLKKKLRHITSSDQKFKDLNVVDNEPSLQILVPINEETLCSISLRSSALRLFCLS